MQEEAGPDNNFMPFAEEGQELTELVDNCMNEMSQRNNSAAQLENKQETI